MLSDECIFECPEHTEADEATQICKTIDYSLKSNLVLIIMFGVLIALI